MSDAEELVSQYDAAFNGRDWEAYNRLFSPEVEVWAAGDARVRRAQAMRDWDRGWAEAFANARISSLHKTADDDRVVSDNRFSGTHTGTLHTPKGQLAPTGKQVDVPLISVFEVEGGKLKAQRIYYNRLDFETQLGIAPATE